jgi:hypothetical protein
LSGKTAWVNGSKITGNMPNRGAVTASIKLGETYTIPAGYHNGNGKVTAATSYVISGTWSLNASKMRSRQPSGELTADVEFNLYFGTDGNHEGSGLTFN